MDLFQTERRLKSAYTTLGEIVFKDLIDLRTVNIHDGRLIEVLAHIRSFQDELARHEREKKARADAL